MSPLECLKNQPTTASPSPPHTAASSMYPTYKHFPTPQRGSLSSSLGATEIVTQNLNPDPPHCKPREPQPKTASLKQLARAPLAAVYPGLAGLPFASLWRQPFFCNHAPCRATTPGCSCSEGPGVLFLVTGYRWSLVHPVRAFLGPALGNEVFLSTE